MKKSILKKYANLIATVGVNIKKGQTVFINAELDQPEFVRILVAECYKAGAKRVIVDWADQEVTSLTYKYCSLKTLSYLPKYALEKWKFKLEILPCMIYLLSDDPDGLAKVDQKKLALSSKEIMKDIKPIRDEMENKYQWCIAAVPGEKWAKKVFPGLKKNQAMEKLWEAILYTSRITNDPVSEWKKHNEELLNRSNYLNSLGISKLIYKSSNGTDITVGLMENGIFEGGAEKTLQGNVFNPNIPSEEVFTTPKKGVADGIVYASKPLSYNGQLIDNFSVRFENGKVVEVHAEKNEQLLNEMINMDEGASYLGECALVPYNSPIRNSGILFYNTLFDENACCHFALGMGFNECVKDFHKYTNEEIKKMGVNDSIIHVDFMIGTEDLSIKAITKDNKEIEIFRDGNWAF